MKFYSPLRYPGGKGKLADFIKDVFLKNNLEDGCYVEPYAGGASIALSLLLDGIASKIILNDYDRSIYAFWYSVINETDELCRRIDQTPVNIDVWKEQKQVQRNKETSELIDLGFSTFYLNRTNRSGILKAGVIGGKNQNGNYSMDARFNKPDLINRIKKIGSLSKKIIIYNHDAIDLIKRIEKELPERTLIYFDPPYYVKGKEVYENHYDHQDHVLVSQMIKGLKVQKWIVSYDDEKEIRRLYIDNKKFTYSFNYSVVNAKKGTEVIIYSDGLIIPRANRPSLNS